MNILVIFIIIICLLLIFTRRQKGELAKLKDLRTGKYYFEGKGILELENKTPITIIKIEKNGVSYYVQIDDEELELTRKNFGIGFPYEIRKDRGTKRLF